MTSLGYFPDKKGRSPPETNRKINSRVVCDE